MLKERFAAHGFICIAPSQFLCNRAANQMEYERLRGETVVYGMVVQLMHEASNKFVCVQKLRAEVDEHALQVKHAFFFAVR